MRNFVFRTTIEADLAREEELYQGASGAKAIEICSVAEKVVRLYGLTAQVKVSRSNSRMTSSMLLRRRTFVDGELEKTEECDPTAYYSNDPPRIK